MPEPSTCVACGAPVAASAARCLRCGAARGNPYRRAATPTEPSGAHGSLAASVVRAPGIASPLAWLAGSALFVLLATRALPLDIALGCAVAQVVILGVRALVRARIRARVALEQALARRRRSA